MLDAMIASALKKLLNTHSTFRKRVSVEDQRAQHSYLFLRERQIAFMIFEYFRATGACETVQGLADFVSMTVQNDDVQDFDVRWDHALLSVSEMPSDPILQGLYKSKLQNSAQPRTVMALYDQEFARNNGTPNYQQWKTAVKLHIDQMMRNRNFKARNDVVERRSVTKDQKGNKGYVERKVGECFQRIAQGHCSKGGSCSFCHDPPASGNRGSSQRRKGRSSSPASHSKAKQTDGEKDDKEESSDKRREILCRFQNCNNPSCEFWHLPVYLNYKSEKGCVYGDIEEYVKPNEKSKKGGAKGSVATLKEATQLGCISQDSCPRKSILRELGRLGSKHAVEFSKGTWHQIKIR